MIPGNSPVSPRQYLSPKTHHSPYLHENNHQILRALFSLLYNGLGSAAFAADTPAGFTYALAPAARLHSPFAAPRIFDN